MPPTPVRAFADPDLTPGTFSQFSKQQIDADEAAKAEAASQPFPAARTTTPMDLATVLDATSMAAINKAGQIVFHTAGDSGGIEKPEYQFAVAEALAIDVQQNDIAFWYHLGDVVFFFGQDQYYFEQFYDPYRNYAAPIFAIPGNHDGAIFQGETARSLDAFIANFCAVTPGPSPDSQGAVRTTMDQPGVYFTLNTPFVKFIGLYTNVGEGGTAGLIAGAKVGTAQLDFLKQALTAAKQERAAGGTRRALVLATHHPPFTSSPFHVPSPGMLKQIDQICTDVGIWPDIHLSGHSHLYERYTRTINGRQIPYIVAGMAGYYGLTGLKVGKQPPAPTTPQTGTDASGNPLRFDVFNNTHFGFMRMTVSPQQFTGVFVTVDTTTGATATGDSFTLDFTSGKVATNPITNPPQPSSSATTTAATTPAPKATPKNMPPPQPPQKKPAAKKTSPKAPARKAPAKKASPKATPRKPPARKSAKKKR